MFPSLNNYYCSFIFASFFVHNLFFIRRQIANLNQEFTRLKFKNKDLLPREMSHKSFMAMLKLAIQTLADLGIHLDIRINYK